jgi:hypothetical protein
MVMKIFSVIAGLFLLIGVTSCVNDTNDDAPDTANISGAVNLYDEGVNKTDQSGMSVRTDGTIPVYSAFTNAEGKFTLTDVPPGDYTLVFEKSGYGAFKKYSVKHTITGTILTETPSLGQKSTTQITNLSAENAGGEIVINVTTNPAGNTGNKRYIRFFYSALSTVSSGNYTFVSQGMVSQINPYKLSLSKSTLTGMGFASGSTVYVKVYGDSFWSNEYTDPQKNLKVFPNLNDVAANAVSFIVP